MQKIKDNEENKVLFISCIFMCIILALIGLTAIIMLRQNILLKNKLEFYQNESMREATIVYVTDTCVYVYDDYVEKYIEIDIFEEYIHCSIEVGDTAIYIVDCDYTDADLLGIKKRDIDNEI